MYCDHCGNPNPDGSAFCATCGAPMAGAPNDPLPRPAGGPAAPRREEPYDREQPFYDPARDDYYNDDPYDGDRFDGGDYGGERYDAAYGEDAYQGRPQGGGAYDGRSYEGWADDGDAYGELPSPADPYGYGDPYHEDDPYRAQYLSQQQYRAEHGYQTLGSPGPRGKGPIPEEADGPLKEHRSLALYIVLSILTFGIFGWYYIHCMARDSNVLCAADGEHTTGVGLYILFSFLTLSIYSFYWMYRLAQRLYENAPAYGIRFERNGLVILLWDTVGALILVGPFIAMHHVLRELDELSAAYNERYVYNWG